MKRTGTGFGKSFLVLSIILITLSYAGTLQAADKAWTIMIYVDADNSLQEALMEDVNEMEMVGSSDDVNIVVEIDRLNKNMKGFKGEPWDNTRRYFIKKDDDSKEIKSELLENMPEQNMGDPQTLVDFIKFCHEKYPAQKYALILENHGDGWRKANRGTDRGICEDDTSNDKLTLPELKSALELGTCGLGKKFDAMEFDACLMAMLEVSSQIRNYVEFASFSQEEEPGAGNPYDKLLTQIKGSTDGKGFVMAVVQTYLDSYSSNVTKSAVDMSKLPALEKAVDEFAKTSIEKMKDAAPGIKAAIDETKSFRIATYKDFDDFIDRFNAKYHDQQIRDKVVAAHAAFMAAVIKNGKTENANGLSIWIPKDKAEFKSRPDYLELEMNLSTAWGEFLGNYFEKALTGN
ncbi:MAG: clostripain-related cysteine peptidase [Candidatus Wallbacteria bacterium]|nr:clostripain-related cysteine peptidase [Candidatus Wallbacteria bacterium]